MTLRLTLNLFAFLTMAAFVVNTNAQTAGSLDTLFGSGGVYTFPLSPGNSYAQPLGSVIQQDGKIVVLLLHSASQTMLIRVNSDGSLDGGFGVGGAVTSSWFSFAVGAPRGIALQNIAGEERLIVAGYQKIQQGRKTVNMLRLDRFLATGAPDTSFGSNGSVIGAAAIPTAIGVEAATQKVLVADSAGSVLRLNSNGSVDSSFGSNGKVVTGITINALRALANGKMLAAGSLGSGSTTLMAVARVNANGTLDGTFGSSGRSTANFGNGSTAAARGVEADPFGNIVIGGSMRPKNSNVSRFAAARFTSSGFADSFFNGAGRVTYGFLGLSNAGNDVGVQNDGKVVVTGVAQVSPNSFDYGVVRFNYDGSLDSSFGTSGAVTTEIDGVDVPNHSLIYLDPLCACEKAVVIGSSDGGLSLARYLLQ